MLEGICGLSYLSVSYHTLVDIPNTLLESLLPFPSSLLGSQHLARVDSSSDAHLFAR